MVSGLGGLSVSSPVEMTWQGGLKHWKLRALQCEVVLIKLGRTEHV